MYYDRIALSKDLLNEMIDIAKKNSNLFYEAEALYLKGNILLKSNSHSLEDSLSMIQEAAGLFLKEKDFAGAARCFDKIGTMIQVKSNDFESMALFYAEALKNYNEALKITHPLRKSNWSQRESLINKIIEIKDVIEVILPKISDFNIRHQVLQKLNSIKYNF
ncbi:MAG: hypothetical protein ACTSPH_10685 [Promethearchaeota archaeon]